MGAIKDLGDLYEPPDVDEAHAKWLASCGHAALAAMLRRPVASLEDSFCRNASGNPSPPTSWATPTKLRAVLDRLNVRHESTTIERREQSAFGPKAPPLQVRAFPRYGLAMLQVRGPWEAPNKPVQAAYRHTHWIGVSGDGTEYHDRALVYDVNAGVKDGPAGGWLPWDAWRAIVQPPLEKWSKGSTGGVWCRATIELVGMTGRMASGTERAKAARILRDMEEKREHLRGVQERLRGPRERV